MNQVERLEVARVLAILDECRLLRAVGDVRASAHEMTAREMLRALLDERGAASRGPMDERR